MLRDYGTEFCKAVTIGLCVMVMILFASVGCELRLADQAVAPAKIARGIGQ